MGPVGGELYSCILLPTATRRYILRIGRRSVCLSAVRRAAGPGGGLALGAGGHPHNYMCCMFCFESSCCSGDGCTRLSLPSMVRGAALLAAFADIQSIEWPPGVSHRMYG